MFRLKEIIKSIDWGVLLPVLLLTVFGLTAIFSLDRGQGLFDYPYLKKQIIAYFIGIFVLIFLLRFRSAFFKSTSAYFYLFAVVMLIVVLFFGETIRGTKGWFVVANFSFQPVEIAKVALLVHLSHFFARNRDHFRTWQFILGSGAITSVPVALTLMQPDAGSASIMIVLWCVLVFLSGIRRVQFSIFLFLAIIILFSSWFIFFEEYQKDRIRTFFDPSGDPLGRGYNVVQSTIAVGSGKFFGKGLGFGSQSQLRFLPESRNDFIFAAIAEELGFIGSSIILFLLLFLWLRVLRGTRIAQDDFCIFILIGFLVMSLLQSFINIGMNIGMVPITGIGLPFVSYGGSALVAQYLLVGIILSVLRESREQTGGMIG